MSGDSWVQPLVEGRGAKARLKAGSFLSIFIQKKWPKVQDLNENFPLCLEANCFMQPWSALNFGQWVGAATAWSAHSWICHYFGHLAHSLLHYNHQQTGGDLLDDQEPPGWEQLMRMFSFWESIWHGRRQETGILGNKSSVWQCSATVCHWEEEIRMQCFLTQYIGRVSNVTLCPQVPNISLALIHFRWGPVSSAISEICFVVLR